MIIGPSLIERFHTLGGPLLAMTATTTGASQSVSLQRVTPTGGACTVYWGDGQTSTIANGNTGTTTHTYASAGMYTIYLSNPELITYLDLRSIRLTINTGWMRECKTLQTLYSECYGVIRTKDLAVLPALVDVHMEAYSAGTYEIDSADLPDSAIRRFNCYFDAPGSYRFDTRDLVGTPMTLIGPSFAAAGTYYYNTANLVDMPLEYLALQCYGGISGTFIYDTRDVEKLAATLTWLNLYAAGSATVYCDTANLTALTLLTALGLSFGSLSGTMVVDTDDLKNLASVTASFYITMPSGASVTVNRSDFAGNMVRNADSIMVDAHLTQGQVDNVLLGIYDHFAAHGMSKTATIYLGGTNAAPSGTLQAACPPTSGKEAAYELKNDSCGVSSNHYSTVQTN